MSDETGDDGWSYTVSPSLDTWTLALDPLKWSRDVSYWQSLSNEAIQLSWTQG